MALLDNLLQALLELVETFLKFLGLRLGVQELGVYVLLTSSSEANELAEAVFLP